ncbi:MAG: family transcriptional regulator, dissimilatory nitrate respiration regulator [Thermodesulfobacteriota bacterium]|nr:family transcriptional regulator, dissimilatory nitrate respiration regulator [Thermodesulfobacteriota bacterium]
MAVLRRDKEGPSRYIEREEMGRLKQNLTAFIEAALLFKGLPDIQIRGIEGIAEDMRFKKGEAIFSDGDEGDGFYLVATGLVKIFKVSLDGKEQILHIFGPGEPFGEVPVFTGRHFPASAAAISDSRILFFPRTAFVDLIAANPSLALNMLAVLSMRLRQFTVQIENLSLKEVPGRLAAYLLYLADEQKRNDLVSLSISKAHLASLLGTIPETLSRIFSKMSGQGLIEVTGGRIRLLDHNGLSALATHGKMPEEIESSEYPSLYPLPEGDIALLPKCKGGLK